MLLALIFGMASPPQRPGCAFGTPIGAEIADAAATSFGIPGVLLPVRRGCKVDRGVNISGVGAACTLTLSRRR
jgi:hypothetical protein